MLFGNLSFFYEMLNRINFMSGLTPEKSTRAVVNESPVRQTTSRSKTSATIAVGSLGVGGGSSPNTAYGYSQNTMPSANNASILTTDYPYVVITTQRFGDWKRTLTNQYLSLDGGQMISQIKQPYIAPSLFIRGTGSTPNTFAPNDSLYDTTDYDDFLIVTDIYAYTADYAVNNLAFHQVRSRAISLFNYRTEQGKNIANDTNNLITFSPWSCCAKYKGIAYNPLGNIYNFASVEGESTNVYKADIKKEAFTNLPFKPCYATARNMPIYSSVFNDSYIICNSDIIYMFPDFEGVQRWFIDFGIKAFPTVGDMYEDNFPDDIDDNIGYEDNPQPAEEPFPDNSSDPTDFADPALSNLSFYNIYLLNQGGFTELKQKVLTKDIWQNLQNWLNSPLDSIYSIRLFPFALNQHDSTNVVKGDKLTLLTAELEPVDNYKVLPTYRFYNFNFGQLQVIPYYGNYLDYESTYILYIPCCGSISLEPSSILNQTIYLRGIVDLISGDITVYVIVNDNIIAYTSGNISYSLSLSFDTSSQTQTLTVLQKVAEAVPKMAIGDWGGLAKTAGEGAVEYAGARHHIESTGSQSFNTALYGFVTPFLKIALKVPSQPANYKQLQGMNSSATIKINQAEGYIKGTPYGKWQISGATSTEVDIIKGLIQSGIYI